MTMVIANSLVGARTADSERADLERRAMLGERFRVKGGLSMEQDHRNEYSKGGT